MNTDIRLSVGFWRHPKTIKLQRRLGLEAVRSLQILWLWAAENRPSGELSGMDDEDLEIAADWNGGPGKLSEALSSVGFLDGGIGGYSLHGWQENNAWASGEPARADKGRFARLKGIEALKASAQALEAAGVTRISKADYSALVDEGTRKVTLERLLGQAQGQPSEVPQGDLKQTSEDTLRQPPTPTPTPTPTPVPTPNVFEEHTHDGSRGSYAPLDLSGACALPSAPLSGEDVAERQDGARQERQRGDYEFSLLRDAYNRARQEGPAAGRDLFLELFHSQEWPGIDELIASVERLCAQDDQFRRGYAPGLAKFLRERMWLMAPRAPAGEGQGETPEQERARREYQERKQAYLNELKARKEARKR